MNNLNVHIKMLDCDMEVPAYAHEGDAGLDLRSTIDFSLKPGERKLIPCGFAIAIPEGYAGLVIPRSGLAAKHGISIVNAPGLIDSGYRGEIKVILINTDAECAFEAKRGDRIAQLMITAVPTVELHVSDELTDSDRGIGGFGSSGIQ
ncbi:MAG: dUTP diphosphatase [Eggerthellaceae bacterium]|nr:dUTP diphosphatase [Eggerthellaceae bacterium]